MRKTKRTPTREEILRATAYHEAGHAVVGYRFRWWIRERGIIVDRVNPGTGEVHFKACGFAAGPGWRNWQNRAEREIVVNLAGPMAEARYLFGRSPAGVFCGDTQDLQLTSGLMDCLCENQRGKILYEYLLYDRTRKMLRERPEAVQHRVAFPDRDVHQRRLAVEFRTAEQPPR